MKITASTLPSTTRFAIWTSPPTGPDFETLDLEPDLVSQQLAGRAGGNQLELCQALAIEHREGNQVGFLSVVGDDRQSRRAWHGRAVYCDGVKRGLKNQTVASSAMPH